MGPSVGELQDDLRWLVDDVDQPASQMQVFHAEGTAEDVLQVGAVDAEPGRPELLLIPVVLAHRMGRDTAAVLPVPVDQLRRDGGGCRQLIEQAQPGILPDPVARQPDRRANLSQLLGLLKHVGLQAAFP